MEALCEIPVKQIVWATIQSSCPLYLQLNRREEIPGKIHYTFKVADKIDLLEMKYIVGAVTKLGLCSLMDNSDDEDANENQLELISEQIIGAQHRQQTYTCGIFHFGSKNIFRISKKGDQLREEVFHPGQRIQGMWHCKGTFYSGMITSVKENKRFDILYDLDGKEEGVKKQFIQPYYDRKFRITVEIDAHSFQILSVKDNFGANLLLRSLVFVLKRNFQKCPVENSRKPLSKNLKRTNSIPSHKEQCNRLNNLEIRVNHRSKKKKLSEKNNSTSWKSQQVKDSREFELKRQSAMSKKKGFTVPGEKLKRDSKFTRIRKDTDVCMDKQSPISADDRSLSVTTYEDFNKEKETETDESFAPVEEFLIAEGQRETEIIDLTESEVSTPVSLVEKKAKSQQLQSTKKSFSLEELNLDYDFVIALQKFDEYIRYPQFHVEPGKHVPYHIARSIINKSVNLHGGFRKIEKQFSSNKKNLLHGNDAKQFQAIYGRTKLDFFQEIIDALIKNRDKNDNRELSFIDLGCGLGSLVFYFGLTTGCKSTGIEFMEHSIAFANVLKKFILFFAESAKLSMEYRNVTLLKANLFDRSVEPVIKSHSVLFMNNAHETFGVRSIASAEGETLDDRMVSVFLSMSIGTQLVSFEKLIKLHTLEGYISVQSLESGKGAVSWTETSRTVVKIFIYKIINNYWTCDSCFSPNLLNIEVCQTFKCHQKRVIGRSYGLRHL